VKDAAASKPNVVVVNDSYSCEFDTGASGGGKAFVTALGQWGESVFMALQVRAVGCLRSQNAAHNQPERRQRTVARIYPPSLKIYKPLALQRIRHSLFAAKHAKNVRGREEVCDRAHCAEPMNH